MTLPDESYNKNLGITTGNSYQGLIEQLQEETIKTEEYALSMKIIHEATLIDFPGSNLTAG